MIFLGEDRLQLIADRRQAIPGQGGIEVMLSVQVEVENEQFGENAVMAGAGGLVLSQGGSL